MSRASMVDGSWLNTDAKNGAMQRWRGSVGDVLGLTTVEFIFLLLRLCICIRDGRLDVRNGQRPPLDRVAFVRSNPTTYLSTW